jgi:hypothetical protein
MSALENVHREDDLEFHTRVVELGPSRYAASFRVDQQVPGTPDLAVLIDRRHLSGIECASAVTAESLALYAAWEAAHRLLGRDPAAPSGVFERSWIETIRAGQIGTAFCSLVSLK